MYLLRRTKKFEKSFKKISKGYNKTTLKKEVAVAIDILASGEKLSIKYRDHALKGELKGYRECHVRPDILLIYKIEHEELILVLVDIGTHASLFG